MKKRLPTVLAACALTVPVAVLPALAGEVISLRGPTEAASSLKAPKIYKQRTVSRIARTFRTQPPLVPHSIDKHRINLKSNRCLSCHDRARHIEHEAPAISRSHYIRRDGAEGIEISKTRYFCTQCHVIQADAAPLVGNTFKGVK